MSLSTAPNGLCRLRELGLIGEHDASARGRRRRAQEDNRGRSALVPSVRTMASSSNMLEGSDDVYVHKFTISLGGKTLFADCKLSLAYGRRYGLVGA